MATNIKIGTWNLCLGLSNKKDRVIDHLNNNEINLCALQETDNPQGFPIEILNCGRYCLELETHRDKMRAGFYIRSDVKYTRRKNLKDFSGVCYLPVKF